MIGGATCGSKSRSLTEHDKPKRHVYFTKTYQRKFCYLFARRSLLSRNSCNFLRCCYKVENSHDQALCTRQYLRQKEKTNNELVGEKSQSISQPAVKPVIQPDSHLLSYRKSASQSPIKLINQKNVFPPSVSLSQSFSQLGCQPAILLIE